MSSSDSTRARIDTTASYYDRFADVVAKRLNDRDFSKAIALFTGLLPDEGVVLDVGCGAGDHLATFEDLGYDALGIEPSAAMRALVWEKGLQAIDGSFEELPELDLPNVGGVWCAASLLHVPIAEVPAALANVRTLLPEGGPFFVTVRLGDGASWDRSDDEKGDAVRFIQLFSEEEIERLIGEAGFSIVDLWTEESTWGRPSRWISIVATKQDETEKGRKR